MATMTTNGDNDDDDNHDHHIHHGIIGMDNENDAIQLKLYATGKHINLEQIYQEILPILKNFFLESDRAASSIASKACKYFKIPQDVVTTFVNDIVGGITLNDKSKLLTSFVVYVIFVGSIRIQRIVLLDEKRKWNGKQKHSLDKSLILHKTRYKNVMEAVEYVVDYFVLDSNDDDGPIRIKSDSELTKERKTRVDFAMKIHRLLGTIYLRLLLPDYEFKDVIFQHLYILNHSHEPRNQLRVDTGVDPMTEGVLIHCFVLKQVALHRAWRMVHPPQRKKDNGKKVSADYDEDAVFERYQNAKKMLDRYTNADYPCVFRSLSEWT